MTHTIAFYNLENLFDTEDDEFTNDNDFLPDSVKRWTPKRYHNKLRKLGYAISNIAKEKTSNHPAIVGFAEVENRQVMEDLLKGKHLKDIPYGLVHYDSPDERGIDVAFIYDTRVFDLIVSDTYRVHIYEEDGTEDFTRDILLVTGRLDGDLIHVIVNHWPSRHDGAELTEYKRVIASQKAGEIIDSLKADEPEAKIIVMGDFNDDPDCKSIKNLVLSHDLYNPMEQINQHKRGSLSHDHKWDVFDQIMISTNFFERRSGSLTFATADVFDEEFLKLFNGPYKGTPFRTYVGTKYKGGYSDHFPVYMILEKI